MPEDSIWPELIAISAVLVVCLPILYKSFSRKSKKKAKKLSLKKIYDQLEIGMAYVEAIDIIGNCVSSRPVKRYNRPKARSEKIFYWKEIALDGYYYLKILFKDSGVKEVELYHYFRSSDNPIIRVKSQEYKSKPSLK